MYYLIVFAGVIMFGFMFLANQQYSLLRGPSIRSTFAYLLGSYIAGFAVLFIINRFRFEFTPFSFSVALIASLNLILYNICSIKALGKINLSMFSVFAMLGGMILPFVAGILFFNEKLSVGKVLCFICVLASLFLTVKKENGSKGYLYYEGVFVFNGMAGVIPKFYTEADYPKTSEAGYSMLIALILIAVSAVILLCVKKPRFEKSIKAFGFSAVSGLLSNVGNFLMLIALKHLPATAQFPLITGGTMIVSTVISAFTKNKPTKKEYFSVAVSFVGILLLVLLDE